VARRGRLTIHPFGTTMRFETDDPRIGSAASKAIARYPSWPAVGGEIVVRVTEAPMRPVEWPEVSMQEHDGGMELSCGGTVMRVSVASGEVELALDGALATVDDALRMFVEAALWSPLIAGGKVHAVHSGFVATARGAGLLLRGESGAGKSTLSYSCVRRGMQFVSDDWVYGIAGTRPDVLLGYPWRMWMTSDAAARFAELRTMSTVPHPSIDREKVPVEPPVRRRRIDAPVGAIVLIAVDDRLSLDEVDRAEAAERFDRSALDSERGSLPPEWVAALLDRPCYVLRRGTDPVAAAELLHQLARRIERNDV
jgi:hypothetical protein